MRSPRVYFTVFIWLWLDFVVPAPTIPKVLEKRGSAPSKIAGDLKLIGYRSVSKKEADTLNKNNKLSYKPKAVKDQLGDGIYTTPDNSWPVGDWLCMIRAEKSNINNMDKIWIPRKDSCGNDLWWKHPALNDHLTKNDLDKDTTLRLSIIDTQEPKTQMMIPEKAIPILDARVDCFAKNDPNWSIKPNVDFDSWPNVHNRDDKDKY